MIVTSVPKRLKIDANSQPMIPPPRTTRRAGTSVWARSPVESTQRGESSPGIGGRIGNEPVATIAVLKFDVLPALDRDRVRAGERPLAVDPLDAVRLEQGGDAAGHLVDDGVLPRGDRGEVERRVGGPDAELGERLARVVVGVRALHPRLRRDAPDAQARAAELRLGLDARDLAAELRGADRRRVAGRPSSENCDVDIHGGNPRRLAAART